MGIDNKMHEMGPESTRSIPSFAGQILQITK